MSTIFVIDITDELVHVGLLGLDGTVFAAATRPLPGLPHAAVTSVTGEEDWLGALIACTDEARRAYPTTAIVAVGIAGQAARLVSEERFSAKSLTVTPFLADLIDVEVGTPLVITPGGRAALIDALHGHTVGGGLVYLGATPWIAGLVEATSGVDLPSPEGVETEPAFSGFKVQVAYGHHLAQALAWANTSWMGNLPREEADIALVKEGATAVTSRLSVAAFGHGNYAVAGLTERTKPWQIYQAAYEYVAFGLATFAERIGMDTDVIPIAGVPITHPIWPQLIADVFNRPVAAVHTHHVGLHGCVRAVTDALGWPIPAPLQHGGIVLSPGPRNKDFAVLRHVYQQFGCRIAPIRWPF